MVFPSVLYREGPDGVSDLIRGIEKIGFDELAMFDHVVMGYPTDTRRKPFYSPQIPIMEAFMMLSFAAAISIAGYSSVLTGPRDEGREAAVETGNRSRTFTDDHRRCSGVSIGRRS